MNETMLRLATALLLIPFVLFAIAQGGIAWVALTTIATIFSILEFLEIMEAKGYDPHRRSAIWICIALNFVSLVAGIEFSAAILTFGILGLLVKQLLRVQVKKAILNISVSMAGILYVGWLISHAIFLRELVSYDGKEVGAFLVIFVLATTFTADTGGYFAGRRFGKNLIAPKVSPKKTWEGLAGGLVAAAICGLVMKAVWDRWFGGIDYSYELLALFGALNCIVGFFGDLVESLIKRDADVKDSGTLLPGHGGALDRLDGVLFTMPFTYYGFLLIERISGALFG